jgi:hypothetical protein
MTPRLLRLLTSRRQILLQGSAVLGLGALGVRGVEAVDPTAKDPADNVPGVPSLDPTLAGLMVLVQTLYPHPALPVSIYQDVAKALTAQASADPASKATLERGLDELESAAPGGWLARNASQRVAMLQQRQSTPFFQFVRGSAAFLLYTRPEVWKAMGYGGDAWSFGGYGPKELNAIDWLPDPAPLS